MDGWMMMMGFGGGGVEQRETRVDGSGQSGEAGSGGG